MARDLISDVEWAFFEPFIRAIRQPNGRKPLDHRRVLDGVFWIARTGAPWRDLPEEFGKWGSVYRQFRRWTLAGLWQMILEVLNDSEVVPDSVQMIDSTIVRAHHQAAGTKGGSEAGSWPLKRWLHDQDPPPHKRAWPAHESRDYAWAGLGLQRI